MTLRGSDSFSPHLGPGIVAAMPLQWNSIVLRETEFGLPLAEFGLNAPEMVDSEQDLDADMARVAALRGVRLPDVQARAAERAIVEAAQAQAARDRALALLLGGLLAPMPGSIVEQMAVFDGLPARSRRFLAALPYDISARRWRMALDMLGGNEEQLIREVTTALAHAA